MNEEEGLRASDSPDGSLQRSKSLITRGERGREKKTTD